MAAAVSLRDAGVRFRMWRRNRSGHRAPRLTPGDRWRMFGIRHITLDIGAGEFVGIIGGNGAGKTTLLKTVAGLFRPDEGEIEVEGRVACLLTAAAGLLPGLNGWENLELAAVLLGLSRREMRQRLPAIAEFSRLGELLNAPVRTYSSGMRARLAFAAGVHSDADILVLDEIMAVGDQDFREQSYEKIQELRSSGSTVLFASHEVEHLAAMADRILLLAGGSIVADGDPREVTARYIAEHHGPRPAQSPPSGPATP